MTDLTSKLISNTYKQVILVSSSTSNTGVSTSLKAVQTGDGTNSALKIATNAIQISGVLEASGSVSLGSNLRVSDKVCASSFYGDGSNLTGVTATIAGNISVSNATVGSNLYVGGTVTVAGVTNLKSSLIVVGSVNLGSAVTVGGAAHLQSTVSVAGAATFASTVTVVGAALLKNNVSIGGTLAVAGAPTFTSKATFSNDVSVSGRLDVATSACIGGLFRAVGAATFDGDVSVSGGLVVGGTVTILGTNVQAANARVCASAYHGDGSNLTGITGGNISGNVSVSNLNVYNSVSIGGNLTASGTAIKFVNAAVCASTYYGDGSNLTGIAASMITDGRIGGSLAVSAALTVGAGVNIGGTLTVAGATSLASTLSVGGAANFASTVTVVGATHLKSTVTVGGAANFASTVTVVGAAHLQSTASIGGAATFASTVTVVGATHLQSTASIGGAATFASTVTVVGATHLQSTASIGGAATFASTVTVVGAATYKSNVSVSGNMDVAGNVSIGGTLFAAGGITYDGDVSVSGNLAVGGNVSVGGTLSVTGAVSLASTLSVGGASNFLSTVTVAGNTRLGAVVSVVGAANFASTVTVVGATHLQSTASVGGAATFASTVTVVGATHLQSTASIGGAATFASTVTVVGALTVGGIASIDDTTDTTSGTTGSIHTDGGVGVAKALYVGTTSKLIGVTTHGGNVVSDTDSTDDLGTTTVRWKELFVDAITATDQITATGFTGTLDGILGSGTPAAATVTTLAVSAAGVPLTVTSTNNTLPLQLLRSDTSSSAYLGTVGNALVLAPSTGTPGAYLTATGLGIGTSSPAHELHIVGDTAAFTVNPSSTLCVIGTGSAAATNSDLYIDTKGSGSIYLRPGGSTVEATVNATGLGVGVTPGGGQLFSIGGAGNAYMSIYDTDHGSTGGTDGLSIGMTDTNANIILREAGIMTIFTSNTTRMTIGATGQFNLVPTSTGAGQGVQVNSEGMANGSNGVFLWVGSATGNFISGNNASGQQFAITHLGALSKTSGSFKIAHPLPSKNATHSLVHSFIEGPQADLIYRGTADLVSGVAIVNIDTAAGMTDGTFVALCTDVQCFTSNEDGWTALKGSVTGNILTITAQDNTCTDTVGWMVIGERCDPHMLETDWTDAAGKVIVEPLKPEPIEPLEPLELQGGE